VPAGNWIPTFRKNVVLKASFRWRQGTVD